MSDTLQNQKQLMKEYKYKINGMKFTVAVGDIVDNEAEVEVNGVPYKVEIDRPAASKVNKKPALSQSGKTNTGAQLNENKVTSKPATPKTNNPGAIKSPLPGTIMSIAVAVGDEVTIGQKVAVLEAMKMENDIRADKSGKVAKICCAPGDTLLEGSDILILE